MTLIVQRRDCPYSKRVQNSITRTQRSNVDQSPFMKLARTHHSITEMNERKSTLIATNIIIYYTLKWSPLSNVNIPIINKVIVVRSPWTWEMGSSGWSHKKPKILELSFMFIALPWPFDNQWFFEDSVIVHLCQVDLLRIPNEEHEAKSLSEYACLLNFAYSNHWSSHPENLNIPQNSGVYNIFLFD